MNWTEQFAIYLQDFEEAAERRRKLKATELGDVADREKNFIVFQGKDPCQDAIEEVLDLRNYVRYIYVKLRLLQERIKKIEKDVNKYEMMKTQIEIERRRIKDEKQ